MSWARDRGARFALIFLALMLFGCDHATKMVAKAALEDAAPLPIAAGLLDLRYVENDDIAFSALGRLGVPHSPKLLVAMALVALIGIVVTVLATRGLWTDAASATAEAKKTAESPRGALVARAGIALILAGAFGNLVDRIVRGYVVDFIHLRGWPVFNVADIAVVVGGALLFLARFLRGSPRASPPAGSA